MVNSSHLVHGAAPCTCFSLTVCLLHLFVKTATLDTCDDCHYYAECVYDDLSQTRRCRCSRGYRGNGTYCEPYDCREVDICDVNADCEQDVSGYYMCVCRTGYRGMLMPEIGSHLFISTLTLFKRSQK